jgi:hypothetical protein
MAERKLGFPKPKAPMASNLEIVKSACEKRRKSMKIPRGLPRNISKNEYLLPKRHGFNARFTQSFDTQASQAASESQILSNSLQEQLAIATWLPEVNTKLGGLKNEQYQWLTETTSLI